MQAIRASACSRLGNTLCPNLQISFSSSVVLLTSKLSLEVMARDMSWLLTNCEIRVKSLENSLGYSQCSNLDLEKEMILEFTLEYLQLSLLTPHFPSVFIPPQLHSIHRPYNFFCLEYSFSTSTIFVYQISTHSIDLSWVATQSLHWYLSLG